MTKQQKATKPADPLEQGILQVVARVSADEAVLVEVEKHVRRGDRPSTGGGDCETGKSVGELVGQLHCARVGRRGPDRGLFGKGERLALELARHAEREGGLV